VKLVPEEASTNSPELLLLKFLPTAYHRSHFLVTTLDSIPFFRLAFFKVAKLFYSWAVLY